MGSCWSLNSLNYVKILPQRFNFKSLLIILFLMSYGFIFIFCELHVLLYFSLIKILRNYSSSVVVHISALPVICGYLS